MTTTHVPLTDTASRPVNVHDYVGVSDHSKTVKPNQIFVAVRGVKHDGHDHINEAISNGAAVVIVDESWWSHQVGLDRNDEYGLDGRRFEQLVMSTPPDPHGAAVRTVVVPNTKVTLAAIASQLYPIPANIVAVTGTNGKTSTTFFVQQMLTLLGVKSASIGTLGVVECNNLPDEGKVGTDNGPDTNSRSSSLTTPGPLQMYQLLGRLKQSGIEYVAIEASSHGLDQGRLNNLPLRGAAFTSFTQDHLDYHVTMEDYLSAKLYLFDQLLSDGCFAIVNSDMDGGEIKHGGMSVTERVLKVCEAKHLRTLTYGSRGSFINMLSIRYTPDHMIVEFSLHGGMPYKFHCRLLGAFQAYNVLCALGILLELGFDEVRCLALLERLTGVPGRMERVEAGQVGSQRKSISQHVYVDYAHTPDGLLASLSSMRAHMTELARAVGGAGAVAEVEAATGETTIGSKLATVGKLIVVFGCGGDRDKDKRPKMGRICTELADIVIVTDDNPRSEDPMQIRREVLVGCSKNLNVIEIPDREQAIRYAIQQAATSPADFVLIAGRGCERFQLVGSQRLEFDDRLVAAKWM